MEQLLKVVLRPYEPVEGIVETYLLLFNDYSIANFQKVLELKVFLLIHFKSLDVWLNTLFFFTGSQTRGATSCDGSVPAPHTARWESGRW